MLLSLLRRKGVSGLGLAYCLLPAPHLLRSAFGLVGNVQPTRIHSNKGNRFRCCSGSSSSSSRSNGSGPTPCTMMARGAPADRENTTGIVWFKQSDLRVQDHEPLALAHRDCSQVAHVFCIDDRWFGHTRRGTQRMSAARCRFLLESATDLRTRLRAGGSDLLIRRGLPEEVIPDLVAKLGGASAGAARATTTVYAHADVCSEEGDVQAAVKAALAGSALGGGGGGGGGGGTVSVKEVWGNTLHQLSDLPFDFPSGVPEIFTQFRKTVEQRCKISPPVPAPNTVRPFPTGSDGGSIMAGSIEMPTTEDLGLGPAPERDPRSVLPFEGGETAGLARVRQYIWDEDRLREYKVTRNGLLGSGFSSKFSPWLALGCISPRTIAMEIGKYEKERVANDSTYWLIFELLWRDFFRYSAVKNGNSIFHLGGPRHDGGKQTWLEDAARLNAWKEGMTGYPFIDANMRELRASGFMSNRGRQVVASFFTKDLQMDWRLGAEHFEEYLLDHDPASNWGNWNYVAGVGSDPREDRYFNIEKQAKTYDAEGEYMRHWLPELAVLPTAALQSPGGITTMLRHMHAMPTSVYPDPVAPLKFSAARKGGGGRGGNSGRGQSGGGGRGGGRGGRGGGQGSGGASRKFKSARLQRDGGEF